MKKAFTLAEMMITIGIIGVVSALTIPHLITNVQKRILTSKLQKSYAMLNQGFRRMLAEENASGLSQTEGFIGMIQNNRNGDRPWYGQCESYFYDRFDYCSNFHKNLSKYFKISSLKKYESSDNYYWYYLNGRKDARYSSKAITFIDGTMLLQFSFYNGDPYGATDNTMQGLAGEFYIDTNGTEKPNQYGRDIFSFVLGNNGIVYPSDSKENIEYLIDRELSNMGDDMPPEDKQEAKLYLTNEIENGIMNACIREKEGLLCAGRVLRMGKMDY
ncbi:type II secretion system protein [bacterium]|nr:type II secretion system protein [bacterium]